MSAVFTIIIHVQKILNSFGGFCWRCSMSTGVRGPLRGAVRSLPPEQELGSRFQLHLRPVSVGVQGSGSGVVGLLLRPNVGSSHGQSAGLGLSRDREGESISPPAWCLVSGDPETCLRCEVLQGSHIYNYGMSEV